MRRILTAPLALLTLGVLAGCSTLEECNDPRLYQQAQAGKKIETPEGLDPLPPERELSIPQASPQAPPPPGACLDMPPTLRTGSSDSD